jgi:multidrug transporter EmrE-like cation transporter
MNTFWVALASVLLSVSAQFALKLGTSTQAVSDSLADPLRWRSLVTILASWPILIGFTLYGASALVWLHVLSKWELSKAYPVVGLGFVFSTLAGLLLGEQISLARGMGIAFICVGVALIGRS